MRKIPKPTWVQQSRAMYHYITRIEYVSRTKKQRIRERKVKECLTGHQAGCQCWKRTLEGTKKR